MQNHNCPKAKYCKSYDRDSCQGCMFIDSKYVYTSEKEFNDEYANKIRDILREKKEVDNMPYTKYSERYAPRVEIKEVIFNNPATIVLWDDGSKTVVKCSNETYDPEKGLAMAIAKKMFGNKGNYFNHIKKWTSTI
jgi:hypothetical protein